MPLPTSTSSTSLSSRTNKLLYLYDMRRLVITMMVGLMAVVASAQSPIEKYIAQWAPTAVREMYRSGVPASITLAQGILESRYGLSTLAADGNNHFGIKCHKDWTGKKQYHDDDEKGECFRVYDSADESFRDHSDFLRYRDRYKFLFDFNNSYGLREKFDSFDEFLKKIDFKKDILSTDPKKIDAATALALTYLRDGHTALTDFSNLYKFGTNTFDTTKIDMESKKHSDEDEAFTNAKKAAKVKTGLDYKDDTVFVDFAQFTNIDEDLLYNTTSGDDDLDLDDFTGGDDIPGLDFGLADLFETNTAKLFNKLYKDLTSDTYNN